MGKKIGKQTVMFDNRAQIVGKSAIVGEKEGAGNFSKYFDNVLKYDDFGEGTLIITHHPPLFRLQVRRMGNLEGSNEVL